MNPFANYHKATTMNFSNFKKMTLEEACLILQITSQSDLKKDTIKEKYLRSIHATKLLSPYLADRIEGAKNRLWEELNLPPEEDDDEAEKKKDD